jgi:pyruvate/2-oxoglutarate dehydrogenase complex dihydrolipoamide acyltransferase (E2) component
LKTKTAYRLPKDIPAEASNIPEIKDDPIQPSESVRINFDTSKAEPPVAVVAADEIPEPDEASAALLKQLAALRASEQAQKEFATQVAAQRAAQAAPTPTLPDEPEARIALWRSMGADEGDLAFLESNPALIADPALCRIAAGEAEQQGFQRGTEAHRQATKENFDRHLQAQQAQPAAAAEPAPAFFAPRPTPAQERPGPASYVSAPVSRREVGGSRELSPRSVRLSPQEQEMARASGISDTQYAEGKLRMLKAKAAGEIQ